MEKAVIIDAVRTPIGRFLGGLATTPAPQLGAAVIKTLLERTKIDPNLVDEVIMGNVLQAGLHQNPARQAAIHGGIPAKAAAFTVNKVCGSGLKSVMLAAQAIQCGYCYNGMIVKAFELLASNPEPDDAAIRAHMNGHLCRCGTYPRILAAIKNASQAMKETDQ